MGIGVIAAKRLSQLLRWRKKRSYRGVCVGGTTKKGADVPQKIKDSGSSFTAVIHSPELIATPAGICSTKMGSFAKWIVSGTLYLLFLGSMCVGDISGGTSLHPGQNATQQGAHFP